MNDAHAQVKAVVLHITVGGHIVEMFGCGNLAGVFPGEIRAALLYQAQEAVKLAGGQEGIDRVGEKEYIRPGAIASSAGEGSFSNERILAPTSMIS